jgi:hypothetical protein
VAPIAIIALPKNRYNEQWPEIFISCVAKKKKEKKYSALEGYAPVIPGGKAFEIKQLQQNEQQRRL